MANLKKKQFFNAITGLNENEKFYGSQAEVFRQSDNIDLIYDSRGEYLGLRMSMGQSIDGKYSFSKGPFYYQSFEDLKIWTGQKCANYTTKENKILILGQ